MATRIQIRRDTAANWTSENPILSDGEIGIEKDADPIRFKIGNGVDTWGDLPYFESGEGGGGGSASWGDIEGDIEDQEDLTAKFALKESKYIEFNTPDLSETTDYTLVLTD